MKFIWHITSKSYTFCCINDKTNLNIQFTKMASNFAISSIHSWYLMTKYNIYYTTWLFSWTDFESLFIFQLSFHYIVQRLDLQIIGSVSINNIQVDT